jgi:hypothetical protein
MTPLTPLGGGRQLTPLGQARGAAAANYWYNPGGVFDAFIGDIYAWRAQAFDNVTWGPGPADYAASKIDENNGSVLVEGNGAVAWAAATGWGFVFASAQWLDTLLTPTSFWSLFVQFSAASVAHDNGLCGVFKTGDIDRFYARTIGPANNVTYGQGNFITIAPFLAAGNLGVANQQGYRNGAPDGGLIGIWADPADGTVYIGAINQVGTGERYSTANIAAVWLCTSNPATVQANVATLVTAMGQL